ncbi:MAG: hypothetical protein ACXW1F_07965 [Halobacteriota archaeon]
MKNRLIAITGVMTIVLSAVALTAGQESSVTQPRADTSPLKSAERLSSSDPLSDVLITPEMIMMRASELKLTPIQMAFIRKEVENSNVKFNELSWQLDEAVEVLRQRTLVHAVDEERALAQLDKVLDIERRIKRLQIRMSIRIRNQLTLDQLGKLQSIRRSMGLFVQPKRNVHQLHVLLIRLPDFTEC